MKRIMTLVLALLMPATLASRSAAAYQITKVTPEVSGSVLTTVFDGSSTFTDVPSTPLRVRPRRCAGDEESATAAATASIANGHGRPPVAVAARDAPPVPFVITSGATSGAATISTAS